MRASRIQPWVCVSACAAALLCGGPALSQPQPAAGAAPAAQEQAPPKPLDETLTGDAKSEYELAKIAFAQGDYAGATVKFQRAHELSGDPRLHWNVAVCETKRHRYTRTLAALERYRREGGALITEEDRREAD